MSKKALHKRTGQLAWDDLKTVLAVARAGSLSGAARALEVEHSTVFRRIDAIETRLGVALFERERGGYRANAHGEAVADAARAMEDAAFAAERRVLGADSKPVGTVRLATSETLAMHAVVPVLGRFLAQHPGIEVEIAASNRAVDLTRREADLALRATSAPPEHLVGRPLGELRYAVFGAPRFASGEARPDLHALPWLGYDDALAELAPARWMRDVMPNVAVRLRCDSLITLVHACAQGIGVAVLPTFAAAQQKGLVRVSDVIDQPRTPLWLLSHPDVRDNARVRTFAQFLATEVPTELAAICAAARTCASPAAAGSALRRRRAAAGDAVAAA